MADPNPRERKKPRLPETPEDFLNLYFAKIPKYEFQAKKRSGPKCKVSSNQQALRDSNLALPALRLPDSVILQIFNELDEASASCLGLTHRKFYKSFKISRPFPLSLWYYSIVADGTQSKKVFLFELLKKWMGKCYRYSPQLDRFLVRKIYDPQNAVRERALLWIKDKTENDTILLWKFKAWFDSKDGWYNEDGYKELFLQWAREINERRDEKGLNMWVPKGLLVM